MYKLWGRRDMRPMGCDMSGRLSHPKLLHIFYCSGWQLALFADDWTSHYWL